MNNTVLLIDLLIATTNAAVRIQELLQRAAAEGRDVTDQELADLRAANDAKSAELLRQLQ